MAGDDDDNDDDDDDDDDLLADGRSGAVDRVQAPH